MDWRNADRWQTTLLLQMSADITKFSANMTKKSASCFNFSFQHPEVSARPPPPRFLQGRSPPGFCKTGPGFVQDWSRGLCRTGPGVYAGLVPGFMQDWSRGLCRTGPGFMQDWSRGLCRTGPGVSAGLVPGPHLSKTARTVV